MIKNIVLVTFLLISSFAFAQNTPAEIYELVLAYYEGDSVTVGNDKAFELFQEAA